MKVIGTIDLEGCFQRYKSLPAYLSMFNYNKAVSFKTNK